MLWVDAVNDMFFNSAIAQVLDKSFTAAGGHADFEQPGRFDSEGHYLSSEQADRRSGALS
jgi:hypothetical protein